MKADAIMKALGKAEGRGMAEDALNNIPECGQPAETPAMPETEAMGPPDSTPPVDTGEKPIFDEATGLPMVAMDNTPEGFPADAADDGEADEVLDFLF